VISITVLLPPVSTTPATSALNEVPDVDVQFTTTVYATAKLSR
jgi:hypothetical protein